MATQIWKSDVILGAGHNQITLQSIGVKKLPLSLLLSNSHFVTRLMTMAGESKWNKLTTKEGKPIIKINYISQLGTCAGEPEIPCYAND